MINKRTDIFVLLVIIIGLVLFLMFAMDMSATDSEVVFVALRLLVLSGVFTQFLSRHTFCRGGHIHVAIPKCF